MQTTAIGTVANSLLQNEVIILTLLISTRYIPYTDLRKIRDYAPCGGAVCAIKSSELPPSKTALALLSATGCPSGPYRSRQAGP